MTEDEEGRIFKFREFLHRMGVRADDQPDEEIMESVRAWEGLDPDRTVTAAWAAKMAVLQVRATTGGASG